MFECVRCISLGANRLHAYHRWPPAPAHLQCCIRQIAAAEVHAPAAVFNRRQVRLLLGSWHCAGSCLVQPEQAGKGLRRRRVMGGGGSGAMAGGGSGAI